MCGVLGTAIALLCFASSASAATITVNTQTDETGDPSHCSLRDAVAAANSDAMEGGCPAGNGADTIVVPAGDYALSLGELTITSSLDISGAVSASTTIDGGAHSRVFEIGTTGGPALTVSISGVTLTGGQAPAGANGVTGTDPGLPGGDGGAILNHTATLTISNSALTNNHAGAGGNGANHLPGSDGGAGGSGGTIYSAAPLSVSGSTISSNTAGSGGTIGGNTGLGGAGGDGGAIEVTASIMVSDSTLSSNTAGNGGVGAPFGNGGDGGSGGAIQGTDEISVSDSTLSSNAAGMGGAADNRDGLGGNGGAIQASGPITVSNSTLSQDAAGNSGQNNGGNGGAIAARASITISGSTLAADTAGQGGTGAVSGDGGAIFTAGSGSDHLTNDTVTAVSGPATAALTFAGPAATLTNVTVARNDDDGIERTAGSVTLRNSLLASNAANCSGSITDGHHNLSFPASDHSCPAAFANGDPKLASSLADNGGPTQTLALELGSAAIDQVPPSGADCPPTDQRGVSRGPACDIGSYEYNGPGPKLMRLHESRRRFTEHKGTTYSFTLTVPATVTLTFTRLTKRHKAIKVGSITISGHAGANTYFFDGELGAKQLKPGRYRLTVTAGNGKPKMLKFTIVR